MAGGNKNIHNHPKQTSNGFDKNPQNINRKGRPKKVYNYIREKGFTNEEIRIVFSELLWHTSEELKNIINDDSQPRLNQIIANQLYKKEWNAIKDIIEHIIGKPNQDISGTLDHNVNSIADILKKEKEYDNGEGERGNTSD